MPQILEYSARVQVYPFGAAWHWKCGFDADEPGQCLGGPARTEEDARAAGDAHIDEQHTEVYEVPVHPDGCRHCGIEAADHGLQRSEGVGLHEWREPREVQRRARRRQGRKVR